jgi:hypothetical protein
MGTGREGVGERVPVAELVVVMMPGSVEDKSMFSKLTYICNPQRS